jgi:hypothetical protein
MIVPATNNGQEGSNRRFREDFVVHPNFWSFILTMNDELERVVGDIKSILFGIRGPEPNPDYAELKEQREITKANYEANLITLDDYLGKVGALSMKTAKRKVASDDPEDKSKARPNGRKSANDRVVLQAPNQPKNPHQRRGRAPNILRQTRTEDDGFQSAVLEPIVPDSVPTETVSRPPPPSSSGLPWPAPVGLQTRVALPSSKSRTTASAVPCPPVVASLPRTLTVRISSNIGSDNSLINHIEKYSLGLRPRGTIAGDGNCWYASNVDLIQKFGLKAPTNHLDLRKAVVKSMETHPQMRQWVRSVYRGKKRDYNKFLRDQSKPGVFTDNDGLAVIATGDYLGVNYHIVGTSNTEQTPVSKIGREDEDRPVFHVGYHQDTTDNPDTSNPQAGHYQSLEKVPGRSVECCGISTPPPSPATPTSPPLITITTASPNMMDVVVKIQNEESILNVLAKNKTVVGPSLKRLIDMKQEISVDILFETKVCQIISEKIQPEYDSKTYEGKMCRKLLLFFQSLCRTGLQKVGTAGTAGAVQTTFDWTK